MVRYIIQLDLVTCFILCLLLTFITMTDTTSYVNHRICINISGRRFITESSKFVNIPNSRLANLKRSDRSFDNKANEFFFDRNPKLFSYILDAYRTAKLHLPLDVCVPLFIEELDFWGIPTKSIANCCLKRYLEYQGDENTLKQLQDVLREADRMIDAYEKASRNTVFQRWKFNIWLFLVDARSSKAASVWSFLYLCMVSYSILLVTFQTHPLFRRNVTLTSHCGNLTFNNSKMEMFCKTELIPAFRYANYVCDLVFVLELVLRISLWPSPARFFCQVFNVIDVIAVTVMAMTSVVAFKHPYFWIKNSNIVAVYVVIAVCCCLRSLRIFKVMQHNVGLRVLQLALQVSARELSLLLLLLLIGVVVFATMVFFAEFSNPVSSFIHIPSGFWWALITMATVGYGDMVPSTDMGKAIGAVCAFSGILALSLTVPVVASNFHRFYHLLGLRDESRDMVLEKRDNQQEQTLTAERSDADTDIF